MNARRATGLLIAAAVVSCSASGSPGSPAPSTAAPASTPPFVAPSISGPTTSSSTGSSSSPDAAPPEEAGAEGIGDSLYPELGNGGYEVDTYRLELEIDPEPGYLAGVATIGARTGPVPLTSFNLDLIGLSVASISVDGVPATWDRNGRELRVNPASPLPADAAFVVIVEYDGDPVQTAGALPFGGGWRQSLDGVYVVDQPDGAATWFPVNDHPLDPATFEFVIEVPEGYETVVSGIPALDVDDPSTPDRWSIPEQTPPYLVALAVGQFDRVDAGSFGDIDLTLYLPPDLSDAERAVFDRHDDMLEFYQGRFGPFPFDRYGAVVINDPELGAALETQTLSTFGLAALAEGVVAHELVHQWFGNAVRVADWSDIWLNEGFATFGQWLWTEEANGVGSYDSEIAQAYALMSGAAFADGDPESGARQAAEAFYPPGEPLGRDLFNGSVYLRGGLALVHLRDAIGDEAMWLVLQSWYDRFGGSAVTTDDFLELVSELEGDEARAVLEAHLYDRLPPAMPARGLVPLG